MDNVRLFLFMALAFLGMLLWQAWQEDYGPAPATSDTPQSATGGSAAPGDALPEIADDAPVDLEQEIAATPAVPGEPVRRLVAVNTGTLQIRIDTRGGTIAEAKLNKYPVSVEKQNEPFQLMGTRDKNFFIAQSGLLGADKERSPTHKDIFSSTSTSYTLPDGEDELEVDLTWETKDGLQIVKRYIFARDSHVIRLQHIVRNRSTKPWRGREYRQFQRGEPGDSGNALMHTYTGATVFTPAEKYQKFDFEDLTEGLLDQDVTDGWIAMIQHYFLAAFIPPRGQQDHFYGKQAASNRFVIGTYTPSITVNQNGTHLFDGQLYIGPKIQRDLEALAEGLELTVDYGWLVFLAKPMFWVLEQIQSVVHNWGWTIILFTMLIKLAFFKLSETSYRSMANMRKLTPRIQALKDRYGDDKQRMQQAMMEMYKKEKINPLGGCLPMLVQIPFFIALYWVLLESVELRQAPWILWLDDLSIKDPFFVLPVIMGASMLVQQKLNPPPPDPMQAKIMMALPIVFTAMFAFFPSGLVLYWVVNNLLSIAQQWVITRRIEQGAKY